jgi:hypothetical protein
MIATKVVVTATSLALSETPKSTTRKERNTTIKQRNHAAFIPNKEMSTGIFAVDHDHCWS